MNRRLLLALLAGMITALGVNAQTPPPPLPIVIVVNEKVAIKTITREELRNIYLGKLGFWSDNTAVKAFDRPVDRDAGTSFYRDVLKMVPARFRHHWQGQQLAGKGLAPEPIAASVDVIARVAATPGGISYLHNTEIPREPPKGVLLVTVLPEK